MLWHLLDGRHASRLASPGGLTHGAPPMHPTFVSAEQAVGVVAPGNRVYIHSVAAAPQLLIQALCGRASELHDVEICHLHTEGPAPYVEEKYAGIFRNNNFFVGKNVRAAVQAGRADYLPVFLSEVPLLFRRGVLPIDVAMITVSPPDKHGYCSLGTSVDASLAAVQTAKRVIAQVNKHMPRTHGDGRVHVNDLHAMVEGHLPLPEHKPAVLGDVERAIGRHVAALVEDGATLQMGIGGIPDAVLAALGDHKDLGIHTEMFSDGVLELVEKGVLNGSKKKILPGKIVAGFVNGTRKLFDFVDDNPAVAMKDIAWVNDTAIIRQNPKVTAINSAIEVDVTGQVAADSIGTKHFSGVGGQMDFIRGASLSEGGKPIIALPSTTKRGESRIVPCLKPGAGVVTTRAHVHYIATEYGVAKLYGKNLRQRAQALIEIAHPDHREELARSALERFGG